MKMITVVLLLAPLLSCCQAVTKPADCSDISKLGRNLPSGVYTIFPTGDRPAVQVYCDMTTSGGRWTVFQRRFDGSLNFYRSWQQYKFGFGKAAEEYWLGLDNINYLTSKQKYELRIEMEDFSGYKAFAVYSAFSITAECDGYKLSVSGFVDGGAGDALSYNNGMRFSTFDRDQDFSGLNCALVYAGAFWYNSCHYTNPNGLYLNGNNNYFFASGMIWANRWGWYYSLKTYSMKIRPVE